MNRRAKLSSLGIDEIEYSNLEKAQGGLCGICRQPCPTGRRLAVDHCHQTGFIRGLLCVRCNTALGGFKEDASLLARAIGYLHKAERRAEKQASKNGGFGARDPVRRIGISATVNQIMGRVVVIPDTDCWEYPGARETGAYGQIRFKGKPYAVHRLMYAALVSEIPAGFDVHHECGNPPCCNPAHLVAMTHAENMARTSTNTCLRGHKMAGSNLYVSPRGARACRACMRRRAREANARRKARRGILNG